MIRAFCGRSWAVEMPRCPGVRPERPLNAAYPHHVLSQGAQEEAWANKDWGWRMCKPWSQLPLVPESTHGNINGAFGMDALHVQSTRVPEYQSTSIYSLRVAVTASNKCTTANPQFNSQKRSKAAGCIDNQGVITTLVLTCADPGQVSDLDPRPFHFMNI